MADSEDSIQYRDCPGWPGYRVDSEGNVWSCRRVGRTTNKFATTWRKLNLHVARNRGGHLYVTLCNGCDKHVHYYVHVLVLQAFVGPAPEGMECRHFPDRDPTNNRLSNLHWGTYEENRADMAVHDTWARGEQHGSAKLTDVKVRAIREKFATGRFSKRRLAREYGVAPKTMNRIINRETWTHVI